MSQPTISSTDRIRDLSAIASDVPTLLSSSSAALAALAGDVSTPPLSPKGIPSPDPNDSAALAEAKQAFTTNAKLYFTTLQSVMARLRRQVYALEEAGIIAAEAPVLASSAPQDRSRAPAGGKVQEEEKLINGGLGGLDVAWLNSRVGKGGLEKEAEVLEEAKRLVEEALKGRQGEGEVEMRDA
ncbi:Hypothetical protein D9617_1g081630 [Elsinoe fawcettii]|nr:Hypothetical protein D9617_1g081630 [Elsinoe fawcettii]